MSLLPPHPDTPAAVDIMSGAMQDTSWMVAVSVIAAILCSVTIGAALIANCWRPILGAKVVTYRTAVILGLICQSAGMLAFSPSTYTVYDGFLAHWDMLEQCPLLTMYALMWMVTTPVIWQALAIWQRMLVPLYLGTVASSIGAALVFPGASALEFGAASGTPPYLTGLGPVFIVWVMAPTLTIPITSLFFLWFRNWAFRGEDSFHRVLWILPFAACFVAVICGLLLIYGIGSPHGTQVFNTTSQGACIILSAAGSAACILMCFAVPHMSRRLRIRGHAPVAVKRMNYLGLDEATVCELAANDVTKDMRGWMHRIYVCLFHMDMSAHVAFSDTLIRIHSTAEEYESAAEKGFVAFQVVLCMFLSVAYGANTGHTAFEIFSMLRSIHRTGVVSETADMDFALRCTSAVAMAIGTLCLGKRLAPVTGIQLAKMTPFRSHMIMAYTVLIVAILGTGQLKGGVITYCILRCAPSI